jgi:excisionase family DNA binding protein
VPNSTTQRKAEPEGTEVLTPTETAAYLRVPEEAVLELAAKGALPGQQIGGEWRFLKRAVVEWLRFGPPLGCDFCRSAWEHLLHVLKQRITTKISASERLSAKRG